MQNQTEWAIKEGDNCFYVADDEGTVMAEVSYVPTGDKLAIIDSMYLHSSLRESGIHRLLIESIVNKMRQEQRQIIPLCPLARDEFDMTPDYRDIRA